MHVPSLAPEEVASSPLGQLDIDPTAVFQGAGEYTIDEYLAIALGKRAIDPINASRVLSSNITEHLSEATTDQLYEKSQEDTGEPVPGAILAPLLRTGGDFYPGQTIFAQIDSGGRWRERIVEAVDQVDDQVLSEKEADQPPLDDVIFGTRPHQFVSMSPKNIYLYSDRDYGLIEVPKKGQAGRYGGQILAARFAIGLSHFDTQYSARDFTALFRIFTFPPIGNSLSSAHM